MTTRVMKSAAWIRVCACSLLMAASAAGHATILTFDQYRVAGTVLPTTSGGSIPTDYGDRVTGSPMDVPGGQFTYGNLGEGFTPNVVVDVFAVSNTVPNPGVGLWVDLYGDLTNVAIGSNNSGSLNVRMTADPGFEALIYGFDLAGWPQADFTISAVRVLDGVDVLFEQNNVLVQSFLTVPVHTSFQFATPLAAAELLVQIDYSNLASGSQDNIGIDNIRFGQNPPPVPIPEPSAVILLALGLSALGIRGRRRQAHR